MACATPVVTMPQAISALEVEPGKEVLVAEEPSEFANAILELLANAEQREKLGEAGRCYVEKHHDWVGVASELEKVYSEVISSR